MAPTGDILDAPFFSAEHICSLYAKYADELGSERMMAMKRDQDGNHDGGISRVDAELVYMFMRERGVRNAIEFSPNRGYSTAFLFEALTRNGEPSTFSTFDMEVYPDFVKRMQQFGMNVRFNQGDALECVPAYVSDHGLEGALDFCFIDSDHSFEFAVQYCAEILPLLGPDCFLFIHDMCYRPQVPTEFSHYGPISPLEIGGTVFAIGEAAYLSVYFFTHRDRYRVYSTHRLFGDAHEYSTQLPRNESLIERIQAVSPSFSLPPSPSIEGGMPRPPMGLFVFPADALS
jgi:predicted O-methyltransferase YrrM